MDGCTRIAASGWGFPSVQPATLLRAAKIRFRAMAVRRHRRNYNLPGHAHELTFSCYRNFPFLASERTCRWLADAIDAARAKHRYRLWAYVFMPDHVHLVVCPQDEHYDIARFRQSVKEPVSRHALRHMERYAPHWLERVTRRRGRRVERCFWQSGGGYNRNLVEPGTLWKTIEYVHTNPVREALAASPGAFAWSSAAWYAGKRDGPLTIDPIPTDWR